MGGMSTLTASVQTHVVTNFAELRLCARPKRPLRLAVVVADGEVALSAASAALELGIAVPVLIGNEEKMRAKVRTMMLDELASKAEFVNTSDPAHEAVQLVRRGEVDILLKGHLRTDELLHAVLDKEKGLRTGRLLSDVLLYEDILAGSTRLVGISDGGLNIQPTLEQKKQIVQNAIEVMRCIGIERPKIATMSATESPLTP